MGELGVRIVVSRQQGHASQLKLLACRFSKVSQICYARLKPNIFSQ